MASQDTAGICASTVETTCKRRGSRIRASDTPPIGHWVMEEFVSDSVMCVTPQIEHVRQSVTNPWQNACTNPYAREQQKALPIAHCNTPPHTATHCNALQRTATHCNVHQHTGAVPPALKQSLREEASEGVVNSTLQHTATHWWAVSSAPRFLCVYSGQNVHVLCFFRG